MTTITLHQGTLPRTTFNDVNELTTYLFHYHISQGKDFSIEDMPQEFIDAMSQTNGHKELVSSLTHIA